MRCCRGCFRRPTVYRGSVVVPIRNWSIARAHWRPSRIAQTTSDWPRRMSPAAKILRDRGLVVDRVGGDVAARVERRPPPARSCRAGAARGSPSPAARDRPSARTRCPAISCIAKRPSGVLRPLDPHAFERRDPAVRAAGALGQHRPVALAALLLRRRGAQLQRPVGPGQRLVLVVGRLAAGFRAG